MGSSGRARLLLLLLLLLLPLPLRLLLLLLLPLGLAPLDFAEGCHGGGARVHVAPPGDGGSACGLLALRLLPLLGLDAISLSRGAHFLVLDDLQHRRRLLLEALLTLLLLAVATARAAARTRRRGTQWRGGSWYGVAKVEPNRSGRVEQCSLKKHSRRVERQARRLRHLNEPLEIRLEIRPGHVGRRRPS
jgi:hypothetical protein